MSNIKLDTPPVWAPDAVQGDAGWIRPSNNNEVLCSIRGLPTRAGSGNILGVSFVQTTLTEGGPIGVYVDLNEKVDVTAGATVVVANTGSGGAKTLYAAAGQTAVTRILFNKQSDNTTNEAVASNTAASGTLTLAGNAADAETVTIGAVTYTFKTDVNVQATGILTLTQNAANGNTVVIGSRTYTFQTSLTNVAGNVLIGSNASDSLDNLIAAIVRAGGGDGHGTLYAELTTAHPDVTAAAGSGDTMNVTAKVGGVAGNEIATTDTLAGSSAFGAATLTGGAAGAANRVKVGANAEGSIDNLVAAITAGAGSGTVYSAATVVHPTVTAVKASASTMTVTALTKGTGGNSLASTETMGSGSFGAATLTNGVTASGTFSIGAQTLGGTILDNAGKVAAVGTLTVTAQPLADETVTIDSVVYTFKATVSTTARQVLIGESKEQTMDNLAACINADSSAGTGVYGSSTVAHTTVTAKSVDATVVVTAITKGTGGNSIGTTETLTNGSWGGSTLAGGALGTATTKTVSAGLGTAAGTRVVG